MVSGGLLTASIQIGRDPPLKLPEVRVSLQNSNGINLRLGRGKVDIAQNEQTCENPDQRTNFAKLPRRNLDHCVGNQTQAEPGGNAECERSDKHGDKCRHRFAEIPPLHLRNGLGHQHANEDQGGGGRIVWNRRRQRRAKHRQ
jgi:hypothetical protein